jgi:hypothetical protein
VTRVHRAFGSTDEEQPKDAPQLAVADVINVVLPSSPLIEPTRSSQSS